MAEIDANVVEVRLAPQQARALLEQAVEESRCGRWQASDYVTVEEPETPGLFDPHLLGRVLRPLLENAARYTPPGSHIALSKPPRRRPPGVLRGG